MLMITAGILGCVFLVWAGVEQYKKIWDDLYKMVLISSISFVAVLGNLIREYLPLNLILVILFINIGTILLRAYLKKKYPQMYDWIRMYRKISGVLERVTYSYFIPFVANSAAIVLADSCIPLPIHSSIHPKVVKHKRQGVKFEKSSRIASPWEKEKRSHSDCALWIFRKLFESDTQPRGHFL